VSYGTLAELVVALHFAFVVFVALGGFLALRWPRVAWVHLPAALWGALIELVGWVCPLTPLEKWLRAEAGLAGYRGGFVEHYILPVLYPAGLTRGVQLFLGAVVVLVNGAVYWAVLRRRPGARVAAPRRHPATHSATDSP
jgi:Protein of Unknown function (DUF2784)